MDSTVILEPAITGLPIITWGSDTTSFSAIGLPYPGDPTYLIYPT